MLCENELCYLSCPYPDGVKFIIVYNNVVVVRDETTYIVLQKYNVDDILYFQPTSVAIVKKLLLSRKRRYQTMIY